MQARFGHRLPYGFAKLSNNHLVSLLHNVRTDREPND